MNYRIETYPPFDKAAKRLAKRYKTFKDDLAALLADLSGNPALGTDLGNGFRKIRMAIKAKGKGKSGGARVITLTIIVAEDTATVALVYIYDKSERASISDSELAEIKARCGL